MAVLEAWAYGQPVLMTPECNLPEGFAVNAGIQVQATPESIAQGMCQLFEMSDTERQTMGGHGLDLVQRKFTWPKIAAEMHAVYEWVLGGGPRPSCVQMG